MLFLRLDKTRFIRLEKARSHKYVSRKPDGKGGWIYIYNKPLVSMANNNDKSLKIYNNFENDIFSERYDEIQPTSQKSITKSIDIEKEIVKNTTFETAASFDKNGNLLIKKKGVYDKVNFIDDEYRIINGSEVFTHNHVLDKSFSEDDLLFALVLGIKEMRIISPLKTYSLKISYKNKSKDLNELSKKLLYYQKKIVQHQKLVQIKNNELMNKNPKKYYLIKDHEVIISLMEDFNFLKYFNIEYEVKNNEK